MAENETTKFEISIAIKALFWGLLFSIISIGFLFAREDLELSLGAFSKLHTLQPIVFFLEFIPLIFYLVVLTYSRKNAKLRKNQERQIENLKNSIESNAEFAKKIGKGDYSVRVDDIDEKDLLGKSLLVMRDNLLETSHKEREQDWISKGKDIISDVLRQHNDIDSLAYDVIVHILKYTDIIQGSFYLYDEDQDLIVNKATHAYNRKKYINQEFKVGHGLIGQAAFEMDMIYRTEIPDYYVTITSGLIKDKKPGSILIMPLISEEKLHGVIEMASVDDTIPELSRRFIREISVIIAQTVFNLKVNIRTEKLLSDAQELTRELKENEEQLRENAEEMRITHEELEKSNQQLEEKITEVQNAQKRLHSLLENASEVISIYDKDMSVMYESPSVKKILGYEAQEVIGNKGFNTFDEKGQALYEETFKKLLANPYEPQTVEVSYRKTDGTEIYLESLGRNLVDNPAIGGIIFNTRDVTQRKIAEKEQRMRGQMQALSENSPDMIIRIGLNRKVFYANPMVEQYTGLEAVAINKQDYREAGFNNKVIGEFDEIIERISDTAKKITEEITFPTPIGERIMQVNAIPEFNEEGLVETILFVAHDITERKQIELEIQDKNKKIEDSINYAQRIQTSILPETKHIQKFLPKSFIFYKPRDVISGDFPWFFERNGVVYIAAVDCTGHGVPGALLSFIGYFILNNIVDHDRVLTAGQVLDLLHANVRSTLKQDQEDASARDGMDIALVKISENKKKIEYAGAHRPLYLVRDGKLEQFKGNPKAIGGIPLGKKKEKDFVTHEIDIVEGDQIFFFSDGLPDQIGGPSKRKYMAKRIREALTENSDWPISKFNGFFARDFKKWKGDCKQIDDVLLIGIEF